MPPQPVKRIWTIGHSTRSLDEFLELLNNFEIQQIADVRSMPGSRKFPQFNQDQLKNSLEEAGIDYSHLEKLGGRRKPSSNSKNTSWRNKSFRAYADYMETQDFEAGLKKLKKGARQNSVALMCSEAVWWRCHRSMISDILKAQGWEVLHIMERHKKSEHPYTQPARIVDEQLTYGPAKS